MSAGLIAFGILCFCYYLTIVWYTKRWNTAFSGFWIGFGLLKIALGGVLTLVPEWVQYVVAALCAAAWILFLAVEIIILCSMVTVPPDHLKYIVILGARIRGETVTDALKKRLDRGLRYLQENPETVVIVSGGRGRGEDITEALAMSRYLQACGVEPERIRMEEESTTTRENLELSGRFIRDPGEKIGLVTNNFHMYRALFIGRKIGYKRLCGIVAGCNPIVFLNYMTREFFAVLKIWISRKY